MPLIGSAAMLLWFDIVPEHLNEHDEWITREHFPERTQIPGFLRAQRWVARSPTAPRNFISYEVRDIGVLTSAAYEARLNQPSERTRRMMPHFRGMVRQTLHMLRMARGRLAPTTIVTADYDGPNFAGVSGDA